MSPAWLQSLKNWYAHSTPKQKMTLALGGISVAACAILAFSSPAQAEPGMEFNTVYYLGVVVKLAAVLLLFVGGAVILMRWQKTPRKGARPRQLVHEETIRLSPKQAVHLVRVGDQHFLIGATDHAVSLISSVELDGTPSEEGADGYDFAQVLENLALQKSGPQNGR